MVNLYYGSAPLKAKGADGSKDKELEITPVQHGGVQTLTITSTAPLLIFDLDVALEWDARKDKTFLQQLEDDFKTTSVALYDWTNGQVALGTITIYHDAKVRAAHYPTNPWLNADVRIYATNRLRPNAVKEASSRSRSQRSLPSHTQAAPNPRPSLIGLAIFPSAWFGIALDAVTVVSERLAAYVGP